MAYSRITSIENLIASDPGGRDIFALVVADQLRLAAQSLRLARRVGLVSGFFIPEVGAGETDGPPGAKAIGDALLQLGIEVDYITDTWNAPLFDALGVDPVVDYQGYLDRAQPTHLISIERVGRGCDGKYRNMHGLDISSTTTPLDELFLAASRRGLATIGIGDGGNEIGMGKIFASPSAGHLDAVELSPALPARAQCVVGTDFCIAAGVSNWGAYGLVGALSILEEHDLLPAPAAAARNVEEIVKRCGAVDGITHRNEPTVDGIDTAANIRMLEGIRHQITPSPFKKKRALEVGILGYGESGRAAAALLVLHGHRVRISDAASVTLDAGMTTAGVETGGHTIEFLAASDVIILSPGVSAQLSILEELHRRGVPLMSESELAYQLGSKLKDPLPLIAITGTIGKRSTVELMQRVFSHAGKPLAIGGNRGVPLSRLLIDEKPSTPIALAVSSFQLESIVHFKPTIAVLLNVKAQHLDRHRTVAEYTRVKSRIFMNQGPGDALILPFDDPKLRTLARKHRGKTYFISTQQAVDRGAWCIDGVVRVNIDGVRETIGPAHPRHGENLLAALLTARLHGISAECLTDMVQLLNESGSTA
jgi:hypothetical protein